MQIERFCVSSHMDELKLGVIVVKPDKEPKAVLQILHGMCEHKERYLPFMEYLAEHGFASIIHDHRGHGESVKEKGDLGYMYECGAKAIVEDTNQVNRLLRKTFPNVPCFLFGHSMGSLVARSYIKRYDRVLDGAIICGSPSNNKLSRFGSGLAKVSGKIFGDKAKANHITKLMFGHYNDDFENVTSENSWICANEDTVRKYDEDERCGFIFTFNGMENLCKLVTNVYDKNNWQVNRKDMPIWFISGADDPCMGNHKSFEEAVQMLRDVGYTNVTSKLYKGMRHEILNEKDCNKVYRDILTQLEVWVDRCKK